MASQPVGRESIPMGSWGSRPASHLARPERPEGGQPAGEAPGNHPASGSSRPERPAGGRGAVQGLCTSRSCAVLYGIVTFKPTQGASQMTRKWNGRQAISSRMYPA